MRLIEKVRMMERMGAAEGRCGVGKWVSGWRRLRRLQRAVDTMPEVLYAVFGAVRYEDLGYGAIAARLGVGVDEVERRFAWSLYYLTRVAHGWSVEEARAEVPVNEAEIAARMAAGEPW
ncbi:MAG TPA: hypothetical protein VKQ27_16315 [Acetobacteraceae bacterium]|nr:hypothetical protein [Acetobacteraceae bacterium]